MIVRAAPPEHFGWLVERIGCSPTAAFRAFEAIRGNGTIAGMVAFDTWWGNAAQMHFSVEDPITLRRLLPLAFRYVFTAERRGIVMGWLPASRKDLLKMAKRVGYREIFRVKDGWAIGVDTIVLEMRREDCRWLEE